MPDYTYIREHLVQGRTEPALEALKEQTAEHPALHRDVLLLQNRYARWKRERDVIGDANAPEINRIHEALLSLLEHLENPDSTVERNRLPRWSRSVWIATGTLIIALIAIGIWLVRNTSAQSSLSEKDGDFTLRLQLHGPGGPEDLLDYGTVEVYLGAYRVGERAVDSDGKLVFEDVPAIYAQEPIGLSFRRNFRAVGQSAETPGPLGRLDVIVEPIGTLINGKVLDASLAPAVGAVLEFGGKPVLDTTDERGNFSIQLPLPSGAEEVVRIYLDGSLRYDNYFTVDATVGYTWQLDPEN